MSRATSTCVLCHAAAHRLTTAHTSPPGDETMTAPTHSTLDTSTARPTIVTALRVVASLVVLIILVQAVFAGRGLNFQGDSLKIHGGIGNVTFLLVLVQLGLTAFAGFRGRTRNLLLGTSALLTLLVVAQLGLGYSGREGGQAAALHIPNGVLIFGLAVAYMSLLSRYGTAART